MRDTDGAYQDVMAAVIAFIAAFAVSIGAQALALPHTYSLPLMFLSMLLIGASLGARPGELAISNRLYAPAPLQWARASSDIDEALYWDLFENASDIVFTTDVSGHFVTGNRAVERLLGYTVREAQQLTWEKLVAPHDMNKARRMFKRHARGERFINYELDVVVKNGEIRTFEISSRPLFVSTRLVGFHGIARDVTDRKKIQQAAILARKEAEQASQAKSFFLANMSHEIRTPINGILGFLSLLAKTDLDTEQKKYFAPIEQSAQNLLRIVDDILDLSKIEAGEITIKREIVDLVATIRGVVELQRPLAMDKGLDLNFGFDQAIPSRLIGDATRVAQVAANLVNNAVKFTRQGKIDVTVSVVARMASAVRLEIAVRDTGVGIPKHLVNDSFEPFRQLDPARDRRSTGAGLGLTITRNLVVAMGGEMALDSEPGRYTEARVVLPFATAADMQDPPSSFRALDGHGLRILVVDDNEINRRYLAVLLRSLNISALEAHSGDEAIELLCNEGADLVLMDIHMAGMDGVEATQRIRRLPGVAQVPVIAVSADVMGDETALIRDGLDGFIAKPVQEQALLEVLATHFPRRVLRYTGPPVDGFAMRDEGAGSRSVLDPALGVKLASGNETLWCDSLRTLLVQLPDLFVELEAAAKRGDFAALADRAHQLAGTAGYLAAADLAAVARELKEAAAGPGHAAAFPALSRLRDAADRLRLSAAKRGIHPGQ